MIYKLINGSICVTRVIERFNIDYSGFIPRVPNYVISLIKQLEVPQTLVKETVDVTVTAYKCELPSYMRVLRAVSYNGYRLPRVDRINEDDVEDLTLQFHPDYKYQPDNYGNLTFTFEEGDVKLYIRKLPLEFDVTRRLWFPLVPDNEDFLEAADWYILKRVMERGHNVPGYSFKDNNPYTNPGLAYDKARKVAINSLAKLDADDRKELSDMMNTFILNANEYYNGEFNQNTTP